MSSITLTPMTPQVMKRKASTKQKTTEACQACRKAKVKCNGEQPCQRCSKRQFECYKSHDTNYLNRVRSEKLFKSFQEIETITARGLRVIRPDPSNPLVSKLGENIKESLEKFRTAIDNITDTERDPNLKLKVSPFLHPAAIFPTINAAAEEQKCDNEDLPSKSAQERLVSLYFQYRWRMFPCVHKSRFMQQFTTYLSSSAPPPDLHFHLMLLTILAHGAKFADTDNFCSDPTRPETAGNVFMLAAQQKLEDALVLPPSLRLAQALLLMSLWELGAPRRYRANVYIQMMIQNILTLKLHVPETYPLLKADPDEYIEALVVFWSAYFRDTDYAVKMRVPYQIPNSALDTISQLSTEDFKNPEEHEVMGFFAAIIRFSRIVRLVRVFPDTPDDVFTLEEAIILENKLSDWLASLPPFMQYLPTDAVLSPIHMPTTRLTSIGLAIHVQFFLIKLQIYNGFARAISTSLPTSDSHPASSQVSNLEFFYAQCTQAAENIIRIISGLSHRPEFWISYLFITLFQSLRIHLANILAATEVSACVKSFYWFTSGLIALSNGIQHRSVIGTDEALKLMEIILDLFDHAVVFVLEKLANPVLTAVVSNAYFQYNTLSSVEQDIDSNASSIPLPAHPLPVIDSTHTPSFIQTKNPMRSCLFDVTRIRPAFVPLGSSDYQQYGSYMRTPGSYSSIAKKFLDVSWLPGNAENN